VSQRIRNPWDRWYSLAVWCGPNGIRKMAIRRWPVCVRCNVNVSQVADHVIPHRGDWSLFTDLDNNVRGMCKPCHDAKTANEDGGFGHAGRAYDPSKPVTTGESGKQFSSGGPSNEKMAELLSDCQDIDVASLLKGLQ
jgi:5-methylcytosine-specific restriction endonuclease McrA